MKKTLLLIGIFMQSLISLANHTTEQPAQPLANYTGFYSIKNFYGKVFIRDSSRLMLSITEDPDVELIHVQSSEFHLKGDPEYKIFFHVTAKGACKGFNFKFPAHRKRADLIGRKNNSMSAYAIDTEVLLTDSLVTPHFKIFVEKKYLQHALKMKDQLELHYDRIVADFKAEDMPLVTLRVYPDLQTYHSAVHNPFAPEWQKGQAWGKEEIRMTLEDADSIAINGGALHEFIHCIHMHVAPQKISPKWFWEGLAMYKGCCKFFEPKQLPYLKKGNFPTLKQISNDRTYQKNYELGYFLIEFIDRNWGWEKVLLMMQHSGDVEVLSITTKEFETGFYKYLQLHYL